MWAAISTSKNDQLYSLVFFRPRFFFKKKEGREEKKRKEKKRK
jgi:hypothetical protein